MFFLIVILVLNFVSICGLIDTTDKIAIDFQRNEFSERAREKLFDLDIGGAHYRKDRPATRDDIALVIKAVKNSPSIVEVADKFFAKPDTEMLVLVLLAAVNSPEVTEADRRVKELLTEELKSEIQNAKNSQANTST